ncbi:hypothetical protein MNBD_BACTEROID07-1343, partial [hydrothermal vent metagenome]
RNRILGDGVMYGNFEFRWKFYKFHFINQNFIIAVDHGKTFNVQDGTSGTYMGLGYMF